MRDENIAKEQLLTELSELQKRFVELKKSEAERQQAEAVLWESGERYRTLIEESFDGIFIQKGLRIIFANQHLHKMLGYQEGELEGLDHWVVYHPDYQDITRERAQARLHGNEVLPQYEVKLQRKDGTSFDGEIRARAIMLGNEPGIQVWVRDITERKRAEEQLKYERQKFSTISENVPFGMLMIDADGKFTYTNPKFKELFGYDLSDVPDGETWFRKAYPDPEYRHTVISSWINDLEKVKPGEKRPRVSTVTCKDGTKKIINFIPVQLETGEQIISCEDTTDRKRIEEALRESEDRYRDIVESSRDIMCTHDLTGQILWVNEEPVRILGYAKNDILKMNIRDLLVPERKGEFDEFLATMRSQGIVRGLMVLQTAKGERRIWEYHNTIRTEGVTEPIVRSISRDVTEHMQAQRKLKESEERYRVAIEKSNDGVAIVQGDNHIYVNQRFVEMFGYDHPNDIIGKPIFTWIHPDDQEMVKEYNRRRQRGEPAPSQYEFKGVKKDEEIIFIEVSSAQTTYLGESATLAYLRDITERKWVEEALRESQARLQEAHRLAHIGIWKWTIDTDTVDWSEELYHIAGMDPQLPAPSYAEHPNVYTPESMDRLKNAVERTLETGEPYQLELEFIRPDGSTRWVNAFGGRRYDDSGRLIGLHGTVQDITERKWVEEALRLSETKYRLIAENVSDIIWTADLNYIPTYISPLVEKIRGFTVEEALSQKFSDIMTPQSLQDLLKAIRKVKEKIKQGLRDEDIKITIELEEYHKNGSTIWMENEIKYLFDKNQQPVGIIGVTRDITKRKLAEEERQRLMERLNRAEKMEALGTLAGGVAHDLNNVLGVLVGYSELLLEKISEDSPLKKYVDNILQSGLRGAAIIQDLLTLARRGVALSKVVNLNEVIRDHFKTPEFENLKAYHPQVTFKTDLDKDLLNIKGSPVHLGKTIMNLLSNAAEAISQGGEVMIRTENRYLDRPIRGYDEMQEGDYVVLTVSDNGRGISGRDLGKIFEPFYTKKVMGRSGTGLGLAVVWGTVKDHNGYIDVQSEEEKGSRFTLYFPITREEPEKAEEDLSPAAYLGKGESILVVDDIKEQRELAINMLSRLNYEVMAVSSGEEAVGYLRDNQADLVVLDMIMDPGIDGLRTYERILGIKPKQKAIIVSGFSETDRVRKALKLGAGTYIRKPYVLEKIGLAIRKELDK